MLRRAMFLILLFPYYLANAQNKFQFTNDPKYKEINASLVKLLPAEFTDQSEFQLRFWFDIQPIDIPTYDSGLLLITFKSGKWSADRITFNDVDYNLENNIMKATSKIEIKLLKSFEIQQQVNQLIADGLYNCKKIDENIIVKLAIKRGYDLNKGVIDIKDGSAFWVEMITPQNKRAFSGFYPETFYKKYDKLVPELLPLIKIHRRLLMLAGVRY